MGIPPSFSLSPSHHELTRVPLRFLLSPSPLHSFIQALGFPASLGRNIPCPLHLLRGVGLEGSGEEELLGRKWFFPHWLS